MTALTMGGRSGTSNSPLLVFTAAPATGHTAPILFTAKEMIKRGFEVVFMTSSEFKEGVEKIGAEYYETTGFWPPGQLEMREKIPIGPPRLLFDMENIFLAAIPGRSASLKALLEMLHERDPDREVIIVHESAAMAVPPFLFGAPLPKGYKKFPKVLGLNVIPMIVTSIDTGPFGPGLPPDSTESGRARNKLLCELMQMGLFAGPQEQYKKQLTDLGATSVPEGFFMDSWLNSYDCLLQMCSPSMEYPRSDLHPSIRYAGALPKRGVDPNFPYPSWWSDIKANAALPADSPDKKKVVMVSQGTVATDYTELIIPTIKAFASRSDVLLLVVLGVKDAKLPSDLEIPANTHVVDYLPYDAGLEYTDVFVNNAGYGGQIHGVINGVPMVMAGETEDKFEVAARAEWAGWAVNLRTQHPTPEAIHEGVEKILKDNKYKLKVKRLQQENIDLDALSIVEKQIWALSSNA
jgi:UDP:flavonoid glycosyltransferase YjiC (YdhE family)